MIVVSAISQKGGVGKSAVARLVAREYAVSGWAVRVADFADGQRRALGVEALEVILSREEAEVALPLVRREFRKGASLRAAEIGRSRQQWVADIVADPDGVWRSSWLAACARHASSRAR